MSAGSSQCGSLSAEEVREVGNPPGLLPSRAPQLKTQTSSLFVSSSREPGGGEGSVKEEGPFPARFSDRTLSERCARKKKKKTKTLIQKLARLKAAHYELDPSEETRKWYTVISCCIQRANARILSGHPTPGRRAPPPRSLLAGAHDLALCGS